MFTIRCRNPVRFQDFFQRLVNTSPPVGGMDSRNPVRFQDFFQLLHMEGEVEGDTLYFVAILLGFRIFFNSRGFCGFGLRFIPVAILLGFRIFFNLTISTKRSSKSLLCRNPVRFQDFFQLGLRVFLYIRGGYPRRNPVRFQDFFQLQIPNRHRYLL